MYKIIILHDTNRFNEVHAYFIKYSHCRKLIGTTVFPLFTFVCQGVFKGFTGSLKVVVGHKNYSFVLTYNNF